MNRLAQEKKVCALIPARLNSVRFPGKALKQIDGIPMVVRVLAAARNSGVFDAVYAATDSPEIAAVCQTYGFEAVFTSHSHQNPTSRIQEAVTILEDSKSASSQKFDFYAMIGGDEPLLTPEILQNFMEQALTVITSKENVQRPFLINAMADIPNDAETADPSNIKVVCRPDGTGLYISRAPIPFRKGTLDEPSRKICEYRALYAGIARFLLPEQTGHSGTDRGRGFAAFPRIWENDPISSHLRIYAFRRHPRRP